MILGGYQLVCKNCQAPILLPVPKHGRIQPRQSYSPKDIWSKNVLCPACKHLCAYTVDSFHPKIVPSTGQIPSHPRRAVFCVEVPCDEPNCESPVKILGVADVLEDKPIQAVLSDLLGTLLQSVFEETKCPKGHPWGMQIAKATVREEPDWLYVQLAS